MNRIALYLLFALAIQILCYADVTKLSSEDRRALQDSSRFHQVYSTKDLPPPVVALCVDDKGKLADPGQNWNATDAITDPTLPWKRLIWAAVGSEYYVGVACRWTPTQRLRGISRRIANRKTGRSFRLSTLNDARSAYPRAHDSDINTNESGVRTPRTPKALRAKFTRKHFPISRSFRSAHASSRRFCAPLLDCANIKRSAGARAIPRPRCFIDLSNSVDSV